MRMPFSSFWIGEISYLHLWETHHSLQRPQTSQDDYQEANSCSTPRLQRMLLCLQRYDYTLIYKPGTEIILANRLSRFPSRKENIPIELHQNIQHLAFTSDKINILRGSVETDPILSTVYHLTLNGCPDKVSEVPRIARHFWGQDINSQ